MGCFKKSYRLLITALVLMQAAGCSKIAVYDSLVGFARSGADLRVEEVNISVGKVVWLSNVSDDNKSKPAIVMIHGFGNEKDSWVELASEFSDKYRLIIPDLPGNGDSTQDISLNYSIDQQTKNLREFLESIKAGKAHIVGNSMGGAIALRYAWRNPAKVLSLTLIDSHGAIKTPSHVDRIYKETGKLPMLDINNVDDFKASMEIATAKSRYLPDFMFEVLAEKKIARKALEKKMFADMIKDMDQTDILSEIKTPALVLWGKEDKILHVDNAALFDTLLPNSRKVILDGVGHVPQFEDFERTAEVLLEFLGKYD